jgi:hypothetical protein
MCQDAGLLLRNRNGPTGENRPGLPNRPCDRPSPSFGHIYEEESVTDVQRRGPE